MYLTDFILAVSAKLVLVDYQQRDLVWNSVTQHLGIRVLVQAEIPCMNYGSSHSGFAVICEVIPLAAKL
jgi:hypothetical protein